MFIGLFMGLVAVSAAGDPSHHHRTTIDHRGTALAVEYRAAIKLGTRQIGMAPPTRMSVVRCTWTARVSVERHMAGNGNPLPIRLVSNELELEGSQPGTCAGAKKAIDRAVAQRGEEIRGHVLAMAERDRASLLAELEAASGAAAGAS